MLSKEEIEKAKERMKILLKDECNCPECIKNKKAYETLLQYIDHLEQEDNKQNKIIGEMAKAYMKVTSEEYRIENICLKDDCRNEDCHEDDWTECIIKHFEKKGEKEK